MHIQVVQHVPFEGPGLIGEWAAERGHTLKVTYAITERYPLPQEFDMLVLMGGPMDADDEVVSPWLLIEKHFVAETISAGRLVLGVCLGAQIVAEVIGGRVRRGREREIGWFPVRVADAFHKEPLFDGWPSEVVVGHWHGDTFDLPLAMEPVLSSDVTPNQAFVFDGHVVGLQFHLEWDEPALRTVLDACPGDFVDRGAHVMTPERFVARLPDHSPACRELLFGLLDRMAVRGPRLAEEAAR